MCDTVFTVTSQKRITLRAKFTEPEMTKFSATYQDFFKLKLSYGFGYGPSPMCLSLMQQ